MYKKNIIFLGHKALTRMLFAGGNLLGKQNPFQKERKVQSKIVEQTQSLPFLRHVEEFIHQRGDKFNVGIMLSITT